MQIDDAPATTPKPARQPQHWMVIACALIVGGLVSVTGLPNWFRALGLVPLVAVVLAIVIMIRRYKATSGERGLKWVQLIPLFLLVIVLLGAFTELAFTHWSGAPWWHMVLIGLGTAALAYGLLLWQWRARKPAEPPADPT